MLEYLKALHWVPWGLIYLNDIFLFIKNINLINYVDDNTLYRIGKNLYNIELDLQSSLSVLQKCFYENHMISQSRYVALHHYLMFILDSNLKLDAHIKSLWRNSAQKPSTFTQINKYLTNEQKFLVENSVVKSQFNYFPLISMFWFLWFRCWKAMNNSSNHVV